MVGGDEQLAGLDDRLQRVRVLRDDRHLDRGLAVVGAEAGGRVGHVGVRGLAHDPRAELLQALLQRREVLDLVGLAVADDHVGRAVDDRLDELGDVAAVVLVVGVGVDDHVGAELQAGVEPGLEAGGQALVVRQLDDVVDAVGARDLDRAVGRAVVDDQPLDHVEALDRSREVGERRRAADLLVEAGDLDDQLHRERKRAATALAWHAVRRRRCRTLARSVSQRSGQRAMSPVPGFLLARPHGVHDAHPAPTGHRCPGPYALAADRARRPRAGDPRRVPRLSDVPELRQLLLAALGSRAAPRRPPDLRGLPRADRAPAGDRLRRAALAARATPPTA